MTTAAAVSPTHARELELALRREHARHLRVALFSARASYERWVERQRATADLEQLRLISATLGLLRDRINDLEAELHGDPPTAAAGHTLTQLWALATGREVARG